MGTRSFIIIEDDGKFRGIYCHWDGYLEHNGAILLTHYNSTGQVNALIDGGDMSALAALPEECSYYSERGDKWENIKPTETDTLQELVDVAEGSGCEFIYLFEARTMQWSYAERGAQFFGMGDGSDFSSFSPLTSGVLQSIQD